MINFTQGDQVILSLTAVDGDGNPVDLTGASFVSQILGYGGMPVSFPNGQHTADPDQVANRGQYTLALSIDDTTSCNIGYDKDILTLISLGSTPIMYRARILNVLPPVPLQ